MPVTLLNNVCFDNQLQELFVILQKSKFLGKRCTDYFNFPSFGLKQWNKGKTTTENHIPFLLGLIHFSRS